MNINIFFSSFNVARNKSIRQHVSILHLYPHPYLNHPPFIPTLKVAYLISSNCDCSIMDFFCYPFSYRSSNFTILFAYFFVYLWLLFSIALFIVFALNSCCSFTFLKAIAKSKSTYIAFKSEKE